MATSSCSSSSSTNYDVFLSFRGKDTRRQFTCHLRTELERDGTLTFKDNESLYKGEEIARIFDAIAASRMSIPIFSQNYCDSKWCLDEIVKIMEARKEKGQIVFPIFYHVNPGDVKNQTGSFGQQFQQLADKSDPDKVESWKKALKQAGKLVGLIIKEDNENESEIIQKIVKDVRCQLKENSFDVPEDLVGIDSRVDEFLNLLDVESEDVKFIGISGMGGIGKEERTKLKQVLAGAKEQS